MKIHTINPNVIEEGKIGISYSGGGNRGVVHIGVLRAFLEKKIVPNQLAGVSAGAYVAAFQAFDPKTFNSFTDLKILFSFINKAFIGLSPLQIMLKLVKGGLNTKSIGDATKIEDFLDKRLPFKNFSELKVALCIGATNIKTGQDTWFHSGPIIPALMATSATPGIFEPVTIGEETYIDGGVTDNLPLFELAKKGCGTIYAVNAGYSGDTRRIPKNFLETLIAARDIAQYQTERYEATLIKAMFPKIKIISLEPRAGLGLGPYDFTQEKAEYVIEESYLHSIEILNKEEQR